MLANGTPSRLGPTVSAQGPRSPRLTLLGIRSIACDGIRVLSARQLGAGAGVLGADSCEPPPRMEDTVQHESDA